MRPENVNNFNHIILVTENCSQNLDDLIYKNNEILSV